MKTESCGVCHTDLDTFDGGWPVKPALPIVSGHDGFDRAAALGAELILVRESDRAGMPFLYRNLGVVV